MFFVCGKGRERVGGVAEDERGGEEEDEEEEEEERDERLTASLPLLTHPGA